MIKLNILKMTKFNRFSNSHTEVSGVGRMVIVGIIVFLRDEQSTTTTAGNSMLHK